MTIVYTEARGFHEIADEGYFVRVNKARGGADLLCGRTFVRHYAEVRDANRAADMANEQILKNDQITNEAKAVISQAEDQKRHIDYMSQRQHVEGPFYDRSDIPE